MNKLSDRVYVDSGESTPHLRALLGALAPLCSELIEVQLGEVDSATARRIRLRVLPDEMTGNGANSKVSTVAAHEVMVADTAANQPIDVPSEAI